jgi:co-chaperonin GroES (HSP10)
VGIKPINDWVLVKPFKEAEKTKSGLIIPQLSRTPSEEGIVVDVGPGRMSYPRMGKNSKFEATSVKPGDHVLFNPHAVVRNPELYGEDVLIKEGNIVCIMYKKGLYNKEKNL